ncbi:DDE-domain-containing protein [Parathielavia appendiculata]|uniref:DDE-domain-containing protein n=1 Tax=Parathielavia appendiculata TaxID=2587402 RepID=A0AAN6Z1M8_9PEZI|nr:DDE-domain-containing protein [Parathielavia appendiculata]
MARPSFIECISATGRYLHPLVIFKGKSVQQQWFPLDLEPFDGWEFVATENGWTNNAVGVEWLERIFIPQTQPDDPSDYRLLILDGHGSHTSDDFMWPCFQHRIHGIYLPPHCSHVLQPLDLAVFSPLKTAYRKSLTTLALWSDTSIVGKRNFLEYYQQHPRKSTIKTRQTHFPATESCLSIRERAALTTHVINATLKALGEGEKPSPDPNPRTLQEDDLVKPVANNALGRSSSAPMTPLQPHRLNRQSTSPITVRHARSPFKSSKKKINLLSTVEYACVALAAQRQLPATGKTPSRIHISICANRTTETANIENKLEKLSITQKLTRGGCKAAPTRAPARKATRGTAKTTSPAAAAAPLTPVTNAEDARLAKVADDNPYAEGRGFATAKGLVLGLGDSCGGRG